MSAPRTVEEVANGAALLLGEVPPFITVLATDETKVGKAIFEKIVDLRQQFLRQHHWNFAIQRKRLRPAYLTVTNVTNVGGKIRLTIVGHAIPNGERVTTEQVVGVPAANGTYFITVIDPNTIELDDSTFSGAYVSGGRTTVAPQFDYSYRIALPTGWLKTVHCDDDESRVEGIYIVTNSSTIHMRYVEDVTDYAKWDSVAYGAFQLFIALELVETITSSTEKKADLRDQWTKLTLPRAKNIDATEDPHQHTDDDWLTELRQGGSQRGFVRDPKT